MLLNRRGWSGAAKISGVAPPSPGELCRTFAVFLAVLWLIPPVVVHCPTQSSRIGLRVCSAHIPRSGTAAIRIPSNIAMYGPY